MDGKVRWVFKEYPAFTAHMAGTRATPTIDGDRLYHKSPLGDVFCLDAKTGRKFWGVNILDKFESENIKWAISESVLVDGNNVICTPGGPRTCVVALDKTTGKTVWQSASADGDLAGYATAILVEHGGLRIILQMTAGALVGVNADNGKLLFRFPHKTQYGANVCSPVFHDGQVFISSGYGTTGSKMVKLTVKGEDVTAEEAWASKDMDNHHGGVILVDGYIYGASHNFNKAKWICLDWKTGEMKYAVRGVGKGSATYAEGMLYTLNELQTMGLVKCTPDSHEVICQFKLHPRGRTTTRAHPVVCGGRLYIRQNEFLYVFDVKAK
jgi:outer membrane protein assembly factor BamB